jgi:hypothetical protein
VRAPVSECVASAQSEESAAPGPVRSSSPSTAATMVSRRRLDDITDRIRALKSLLYSLLRHFF